MFGLGNGVNFPNARYTSSGGSLNAPFSITTPDELAFWISDLMHVYAEEDGSTPSEDKNSIPDSNLEDNDLVSKIKDGGGTTTISGELWEGIELRQGTTADKPKWTQRANETAGRYGRLNFQGGASSKNSHLLFATTNTDSGAHNSIDLAANTEFWIFFWFNATGYSNIGLLGTNGGGQSLSITSDDEIKLQFGGSHTYDWEDTANGPLTVATGDNKYHFIILKRNSQGYITLWVKKDGVGGVVQWDKAENVQDTTALEFDLVGGKDESHGMFTGQITDVALYMEQLSETEVNSVVNYIETEQSLS